MKFTDGNWMMRPGVTAFYPAQAYQVETGDGRLRVYAPTRSIAHRGDTLGGPLLTIDFFSPMEDVIGVTITHLAGVRRRPPEFEVASQPDIEPRIEIDDHLASLTSGRLSARIPRAGEWGVDYVADGRIVTRSGSRAMGYAQVEGEGPFVHEQLALSVREYVYGLGERFTSFVKNGQVVETWNKDGGAGSEQAYKSIPFYLTSRGYGVFVADPGPVSFEVASEKVSRVQFSLPGESLTYYVIYGPTPKEVLSRYTALTGRPALPPAWSFGLWLTTSFTTSYDEETVTAFIQGMADRGLPLSVFHFDCFWMRDFHWCDFTWDARTFPDSAGMLSRLKARGLRICLWINPYISQLSPLFAEAKERRFLIERPDGSVWQTDQWQPGMGIVDFTNPAARAWFQEKLAALLDMGVDCFKTDFGERIPTDVVYHDGSDPVKMHNYYALLYNRAVFDLLKARRGEGEAVVFARSSTAGGQRFPVHWGGDCYSNFESMAESLRGGLSLSLCGFGFWSHDIGGFEGSPPATLYKRWIAFGLLSSHSRLHGSSSYRVPWSFDEEAVDVLRHFTRLKCSLMPYLYQKAREASETGAPLMRAMMLEFPDDPACLALDAQYMLGDSLLAAPVFSETGDVDFYVPAGRWTDYLTGEALTGPGWFRRRHGFLSLPLLVRPGSAIAVGSVHDRPDYAFTEDVTLQVYELGDGQGASVRVPGAKAGEDLTATIRRAGDTYHAEAAGAVSGWRVLIAGAVSLRSVEGGEPLPCDAGALAKATAGSVAMTITIQSPG